MSEPANDGGAVLGYSIGRLIARSREASFRKKVGQLLANGDCQGASRFAYEKGRLELGASISQACASNSTSYSSRRQAEGGAVGLYEGVQRIALGLNPPIALDEITTLTRAVANGTQLQLTAIVDRKGATITNAVRTRTTNGICSLAPLAEVLRNGASVRANYVERGGREIGTITVTQQECGF